jgi:hypothetical protein
VETFRQRHSMIEDFASSVSDTLKRESGKVFYSGRAAFSQRSDLYVLGINPGGSPEDESETTVGQHTDFVLRNTDQLWSAYCDESWKGRPAGTFGMQPRVRHLFKQIGRDARTVPCSNLIFVRSTRVAGLAGDTDQLEEVCWPFHRDVIARLCPRTIICFGSDAGQRVRQRLDATKLIDQFVEANDRRWSSYAHKNSTGLSVLTLAHPSIANWMSPSADPTPLVKRVLG